MAAVAGGIFAFIPCGIMGLEFRYGLAVTGGLLCVAFAMIFIRHLENLLIYALLFHIPFSIFGKWLFRHEVINPAKGINLGIAELLLLLAYILWFGQIFIVKSRPFPKLRTIDLWVLFLFLVTTASTVLSHNMVLAWFDLVYTVKHMLMYFFLSHKVERKHLHLIIALLLFAILLESGFAFFERITGVVNIGNTKGNVESSDFAVQYVVPGIEDQLRAAGTTNDSHTLGLYFAMLLSLPLVLMCRSTVSGHARILFGSILFIGILGLVLTFSRSGWLGFALGAVVVCWYIFKYWKQGQVIIFSLIILLAASIFYPKVYDYIGRRVFEAPFDIIEARLDMHQTAIDIWTNNFFIGCGPGNYITALDQNEVQSQHVKAHTELPVHNLYLYTLAEIGTLGFIALFTMIAIALNACRTASREQEDTLVRCLALATLGGLVGYLVDGMTEPMFRESIPNAQFWTFIALSISFPRMLPPVDQKTEIQTIPNSQNGYEQNSAQFDVKPCSSWHCDKKLMPSSHPGVNADTTRVGNFSG